MSLLGDVVTYLDQRGAPAALIGGVALAAHGVARATLDTDLLVVDRSVLDAAFWAGWTGAGERETYAGDAEDPMAGLVRWRRGDEIVDLVVGKARWMEGVLERRTHMRVGADSLPLVDCADLILLKLYAGGPQDLLDTKLLLLAATEDELSHTVEERLHALPATIRAAWRKMLDEGS